MSSSVVECNYCNHRASQPLVLIFPATSGPVTCVIAWWDSRHPSPIWRYSSADWQSRYLPRPRPPANAAVHHAGSHSVPINFKQVEPISSSLPAVSEHDSRSVRMIPVFYAPLMGFNWCKGDDGAGNGG